MTEEACAKETEGQSLERGLLIAGGLCAFLWPLLTTAYYAAYPLAAGGTMHPQSGGQAAFDSGSGLSCSSACNSLIAKAAASVRATPPVNKIINRFIVLLHLVQKKYSDQEPGALITRL